MMDENPYRAPQTTPVLPLVSEAKKPQRHVEKPPVWAIVALVVFLAGFALFLLLNSIHDM